MDYKAFFRVPSGRKIIALVAALNLTWSIINYAEVKIPVYLRGLRATVRAEEMRNRYNFRFAREHLEPRDSSSQLETDVGEK